MYRKDFEDDTITVDPMKYDRWISGDFAYRLHHDARQRKRDFNHEGVERARSINKVDPLPLFDPEAARIDGMTHWTSDARRLQSHRGGKRDLSRQGKAPVIWQAIYEDMPNAHEGDIERQLHEADRHANDRVFDCRGYCR